ncbi:hypothetical protein Tco_0844751 [Tanacetum coccineum]
MKSTRRPQDAIHTLMIGEMWVRGPLSGTSVRILEVKVVETKFEATNKILRTIRGKIKETLKEITKHQPALKEDAVHLAEYTAYVLKLR